MGEALGGSPGLEVLVGRSGGVVRGEAVAKLVDPASLRIPVPAFGRVHGSGGSFTD
jgi:hypothetical protein